jgi:hypothetical protein
LQHHYDNQPQEKHTDTLLTLKENTYVHRGPHYEL